MGAPINTDNLDLRRIAELPLSELVSEEDVKNKVVLPILRALGYDDPDFNFERRTGRGYVDVVLERFPIGIVVETKSPRTQLDRYVDQLENYVFHKHADDRAATLAILTDGEWFRLYAVTDALRKGSLSRHEILEPFRRSELVTPEVARSLYELAARESNESGSALEAIPEYRNRLTETRAKANSVEEELRTLRAERQRIDARIKELEAQRVSPRTTAGQQPRTQLTKSSAKTKNFPATPHILRLLQERGAFSRQSAVPRKWLDEQLIGKIEGVNNDTSVSFSLIDLKKLKQVDYEKTGSSPIRSVWLMGAPESQ